MKRQFGALENQEFDLLVVGGGIFGAAAAWDATLRGLSVALLERADFGGGTSADSFKIVHGGIRYLQHGDLPRLRASCRERSALLRIAPHLVEPLPIVVPTYGTRREGKALLGAGMLLYDALTLDRNLGIRDPRRKIPFSRFLGAAEVSDLFPNVRSDDLTGAAVFCDGQMYNPPRLVLAFVRSAVEEGALALNYAEVERLIHSGNSVVGVRVRDRLTADAIDVRARAVLNAAGPWVPRFMAEREKRPLPGSGSYSRDACFLLPRLFPHPYAIAVQGRTRDPDALLSRAARHLFLVPWRHYTLCGVWHKVWTDGPDHVHVTEAELQGFIDEINAAMPGVAARLSDVSMWNAGLVPFGDNAPGAAHLSYGKRSRIVDHEAAQGISNLVSLVGVRYTMARADAAEAVDLVCAKLKQRGPRPPTTRLRLMGGDFDRFADLVAAVARAAPPGLNGATIEALAHNYGTQYGHVFSCLRRPLLSAECLKGSTTLRAEIVHAARREMAVRLSDIVFRRTDLATGGHPGRDALEEAAGLAARELGWDAATRRSEIAAVEKRFASGGRFAAEESVATAFEMHAAGGVNPA